MAGLWDQQPASQLSDNMASRSDVRESAMDLTLPDLHTSTNPCFLKPSVPTIQLPQGSLDVDFKALTSRSGSTSTPFVRRNSSVGTLTPFTPYFSDGSLVDSAIETSCNKSSSRRPKFSPFCGSASGKPHGFPKFVSIAEHEHENSEQAMPKAVLFPTPTTDITEVQSSTSPPQTNMAAHKCSDSHNKPVSPSLENPPSLNSCSQDTGYESQFSFELSSSLETSDASPAFQESMSLCLSRYAPKNLHCLIGRKIGVGKLDIISSLHTRNMSIPLSMILSQLSRKDLRNMCEVSDSWRTAIESDPESFRRKTSPRQSPRKMSHEKENSACRKRPESRRYTTPTSLLSRIQVQATPATPAVTPDTSGAGFTTPVCSQAQQALNLSQKYWREAQSLKNEECLRKCPKCACPSKTKPAEERALCSNLNCRFDFCIKCHRTFHGAKDCSLSVAQKKPKLDSTVGSKRSKKNLRRL